MSLKTVNSSFSPFVEHKSKNECVLKDKFYQNYLLTTGVIISAIAVTTFAFYEFFSTLYEQVSNKLFNYHVSTFEKKLKTKFNDEIIERFKKLPKIDLCCFFQRLVKCKKIEQKFLIDLLTKYEISNEQLQQILKGAHVRLEDNGKQYNEWTKAFAQDIKPRISSHASTATQYGYSGPAIRELLFSKNKEKGKTYTWFQLEKHPVAFGHIIRHTIDFFKYKLTGKQQGPYGSSAATDQRPIYIRSKAQNENFISFFVRLANKN